ncbi:MAG: glutamine-hydrolyzing GMP synthase [Candidatus Krumholzibacteriota bacterium]|nr:glutamine-hydrolyzing GMP synthase [Candidatus Krumholzibacteriota bacterium]
MENKEWQGSSIVILDFGSQYTQLIGRSIRSKNVFSVILPFNSTLKEIKDENPRGIILSGGPADVGKSDAPELKADIFSLEVPVLGICYGMQLIAKMLGSEVKKSSSGEFGHTIIKADSYNPIFKETPEKQRVWMSHGVKVVSIPEGFISAASSDDCKIAAFSNTSDRIYGLQFHPEVFHTEYGDKIIENFILDICGCNADWTSASFVDMEIERIRQLVGDSRVLCAVSGGVDSSVMSILVDRAIGKQLCPVFVDNGLLRLKEAEEVREMLTDNLSSELVFIDASDEFLSRLKGVVDAEEKRKIIGNCFIDIFDQQSNESGPFEFLAQGTLYPDVIESRSTFGPSDTIKSHHNVGGLPDEMDFKLIEPLSLLFKDEVRNVGAYLGLPENQNNRHPFPGPGLAVRIPGEILPQKLELLRSADHLFIEALREYGLYDKVWQAFSVLLPVKSVGVMGDERTYQQTVVLRAVTSVDGMTADWAKLPYEFLQYVSNKIINNVRGINRVLYDISSKPPATIEWE